jgi:peptidoglycan-associated lipoprotein
MLTSRQTRSALRLALIATAAISVTACASRPKPTLPTTPPAATTPPPAQPEVPPPSGPVGQAAIPGSEQDFVINVGDRVYFDFDSYQVRDDALPVLDAQAAWLRRYPSIQVRLEGNADERGTREYNLALGARRANSVREYLTSHGVEAGRISTVSYGKEKPLDPGADESAYQRNRNTHTAITGGARMR